MSVPSPHFQQTHAARLTKRRYCVDLAAALAECEANYWRLERLLHAFREDDRRFALDSQVQMHVRVVERSPYTTLLEIEQVQTAIAALTQGLSVRVYHDAQLAEVVAFAHLRRVQPRYDYPNPAMHQPDEKAQWNRFLGEWLSHCLQHGVPLDRSLSEFCEL
ncbi:MAG TPA: DUF1249 domain-containing protein [Spongiibacteraceae bacterium]|nr:DUF1249 domain-containing protein [Spongiibacteraceae bacterium]